jgi:hypothetical protein
MMENFDPYERHPLVQSMLRHERARTASLEEEGKLQINYPKSNEGWVSSIFIIQGRALDWSFWPWLFAVLHATVYTVVQQVAYADHEAGSENVGSWEIFFRYADEHIQYQCERL